MAEETGGFMTLEDIEFIRELSDSLNVNDLPNRWKNLAQVIADGKRLLTLLVAAEARGDKAEFLLRHPRADNNADFCLGCNSQQTSHWEDEHFWTDSDWIKAVRERWGLG